MEKQKLDWISNLRALATISVVILHTAAAYAGNYNVHPADRSWWIISNVIDGLVRFCVPVFIMISGILWLSNKETISEFYKKKALRLIGPFLFWSFLFYLFNIFYLKTSSSDVHIFEDFYEKFRLTTISAHFWYVYMLIGLFLITPIYKGWIQHVDKKEIKIFLIVWVCVCIYSLPVFDSKRIYIDLKLLFGYTGYMVLAYYVVNHLKMNPRLEKKWGKILFFSGCSITIIGTHIVSYLDNVFYVEFYTYLTPNVMMAAVGIFMWIKNIEIKNGLFIKSRDSISKYGYGIYLVHCIIIQLLAKHWIYLDIHPLKYIPLLTGITVLVSWGLIYILNKIPFAKYFIG